VRGRGHRDQALLFGVPVEARHGHSRRAIVARARPKASRWRAKYSMSTRRAPNTATRCSVHQATYWRRSGCRHRG
jgi:hypothetical protein